MTNGRVNERNIGRCTLTGDAKVRSSRRKSLTEYEKSVAKNVLARVYDTLEYDKDMSDGKGMLHRNAIFTDGGRFIIALTRDEFEALSDAINKL